jgi:serine/threonine protein kinase
MIVMKYIGDDMRQYLKSNYNEIGLYEKFQLILNTTKGLKDIHSKGFIHKDLHSGNILMSNASKDYCYITDLGLCKPADDRDKNNIYGVLPYIAPEVIRGQRYTQSADIYSFGILAYGILSVQLSFMLAQCFICDVIFVRAYTGNELHEVQ